MFTDKQKSEIRMAVFSLPKAKRHKIFKLIGMLQDDGDDSDELAFAIMATYMSDKTDKELDAAIAEASFSGMGDYMEERPSGEA